MTHHTDAERALFEAVASDDGKWPKAIERDAKGNYLLLTTANGWMWWQAARRAPSMTDQSIIEAVDGWFARNTALGGCSDKDVAELAAIFAATQPAAQGMEEARKERDTIFFLAGWNGCSEGLDANAQFKKAALAAQAKQGGV